MKIFSQKIFVRNFFCLGWKWSEMDYEQNTQISDKMAAGGHLVCQTASKNNRVLATNMTNHWWKFEDDPLRRFWVIVRKPKKSLGGRRKKTKKTKNKQINDKTIQAFFTKCLMTKPYRHFSQNAELQTHTGISLEMPNYKFWYYKE